MSSQAGMEALIEELRSLGARELKLTLASLTAAERAQVASLVETGQATQPSFEALVGASPWLLKKIDSASGDRAGATGAMSDATRRTLLEVANDVLRSSATQPHASKERRSVLRRVLRQPARLDR